jgi:glycosyltransferase involved in cell wall biosynthesis
VTRRHLRVLTLIDRIDEPGGAERFALALATHLPPDQFTSAVCSTRPLRRPEETLAALAEAGVTHTSLDRRHAADPRVLRLARLLRTEQVDILHAHMFGSNLWGSLIGSACRVPVILAHEHNWSYSGNRLRLWLDGRVVGRTATRFVAVSAANRERMVRLEHVPEQRIVVMPTAYIPSSGPSSGDLRSELGLTLTTPLLAVAAVLRPEKALHVLLDALALVAPQVPDVQLAIAGDGPCRGELESQTDRLGLRDRVHFLGVRRDVDAVLTAADVGVMSSEWEGMPLFLFECMAADTALVATNVGGIPEVVRDGETGLLVPPGEPPALAAALIRILRDPGLRGRLATAASAGLERYTLPSVAADFARLYEALAAERGLVTEGT